MDYVNMDESGFPHPIVVDPKAKPEQPFHFYVTCVYGWAKGRTIEQAMTKLRTEVVGEATIAEAADRGQNVQVWGCLVELPMSYTYRISCYKPCVVGVSWLFTQRLEPIPTLYDEVI